MIKLFLFLSLILASLDAKITLDEISSKPTSRAKDFMIWQYLKQDISNTQVKIAYKQSTKRNRKLKNLYAKRIKDPYIVYRDKCRKKRNLFVIEDKKCFKIALTPYKTLAMSHEERKKLAKKVDSKNFIKLLKIQNEPYKASAYKKYPADVVLKMFINTTASHRRDNLNIKLDKKLINSLVSSNKIHYFIKMIINNKKLDKLQESLILLDSPKLNGNDNFRLALFHLQNNRKKSAIKHLHMALKKYKKRIELDKTKFWLYLITENEKYINLLLKSEGINIYTLFAYEKKHKKVTNYFTTLPTENIKSSVNLKNPFEWETLRLKIKKTPKEKLSDLVSQYQSQCLLPVQSHIVERLEAYKIHSFIMPYDKYLKDVSTDDKALIYAIMRQESNFIPCALSSSFALGLMQIMPFLTDAISKKMKLKTTYNDMFDPETNLKYAVKHIKWIQKSLYHPLFLAYAYNGGLNFFRKHLKTGAFSSKKYEPFLSIELMKNGQSREYGKKVLANYVMYKKILGEKVSIIGLFQTLKDPIQTSRYGKQN